MNFGFEQISNSDQEDNKNNKLTEIIGLKEKRKKIADMSKKEKNNDIINEFYFSAEKTEVNKKSKAKHVVEKEQYPKLISSNPNQKTKKCIQNLLNSSNKMGKTPRKKPQNHIEDFMKYAPKYFKGNSIYNKNIFDFSKDNDSLCTEEGNTSPTNNLNLNNEFLNNKNTSSSSIAIKDLNETKNTVKNIDKNIRKKNIKYDLKTTKKRSNSEAEESDYKRAKKDESLHNSKSSFSNFQNEIDNFIENNDEFDNEDENMFKQNMNKYHSNKEALENETIICTKNNKNKGNDKSIFQNKFNQESRIDHKSGLNQPSNDLSLKKFYERISQTNNDIIPNPNKISGNFECLSNKNLEYINNKNMGQEQEKAESVKHEPSNNKQNYSNPMVESIFGKLDENSYDSSKFPLVESFLLDQFKVVSFIHNCCLRLPPPEYFRTSQNFLKSNFKNNIPAAICNVARTFNDFDTTEAKLKKGVEYIKILNDERNDHRLVLNILTAHWMQKLSS